jgi:hypothetical protein
MMLPFTPRISPIWFPSPSIRIPLAWLPMASVPETLVPM